MVDVASLVRDGKLDPAAMQGVKAEGGALVAALGTAGTPQQVAALAILVGAAKAAAGAAALVPLLGRDGVAGKTAAWALAQLGAERELLAAVTGGKLDERDNGYFGLMVLSALGKASAGLGATLAKQVDVEIERAKSGGTGLGEHACRVLAILGVKGVAELIQKVIENDRYCDRFELQRLRKTVEDGGRDQQSVRDLAAPWTSVFADELYVVPAPVAPPAPTKLAGAPGGKAAPAGKPATPSAAGKPPVAKPAMPSAPSDAAALDADADAEDAEGDAALPGAPAAAKPIDWKDFLASPEGVALTPQVKALIAQLGPVLEQLAVRAIQAPLADLSGQELAALLLQVLPQALPPQAVQAALSPQALNGFQAMARYLARTGVATAGDDLVQGVKLVRKELAAQMRQSGILGGPDYSDPDDAVGKK